jgi:hypothetical protein
MCVYIYGIVAIHEPVNPTSTQSTTVVRQMVLNTARGFSQLFSSILKPAGKCPSSKREDDHSNVTNPQANEFYQN